MLTRNSQIGEFYVMSPPQVPPQDGGMYTCDIMIFDEERDTHVRVSWNEALKATLCSSDKEAARIDVGSTARNEACVRHRRQYQEALTDWAKAAAAWGEFNDGKKTDKDGKAMDYATLKQDFGVDIRIVVARPFIEHRCTTSSWPSRGATPVPLPLKRRRHTSRALTARPRTTAGATLFGPADMQL